MIHHGDYPHSNNPVIVIVITITMSERLYDSQMYVNHHWNTLILKFKIIFYNIEVMQNTQIKDTIITELRDNK